MPLRIHFWGLLIAVFVGLCAVLPALLAPLYLGDAYQGIEYAPLDDEEIYRTRIHEILDGHGAVAQPYLAEYKESAVAMPPINEWLYALPAFVFGLPAVIIVSKFLLPALVFFFAYLFLRRVTEDELTALAGGLVTVFSVEFVDYGYMFGLLQRAWPRPLLWTRLVNPVVGAVEVLTFLNLVWLVIERRWKYAPYAAGALLALMIGYYFAFGICLALLGVLGLIYFYRREYSLFLDLMKTGVVAIVLTLPYWYIVFSTVGGSRETAMRGGMFFTHEPVLNKVMILGTMIAIAAFAYAYWRSTTQGHRLITRNTTQWIFTFALLAAGWIAFNEQVLTGREIWHHHFVQYATPLAVLAVWIALHSAISENIPRLWKWGMSAALSLSLVFGAYSILSVIPRTDNLESKQSYGALFSWLNSSTTKDCVALIYEAEESLARFVPAYTHCNVYITSVTIYGTPLERVQHNYFLRMRLFGVAAESAEAYLRVNESNVRGTFFEDWDQALMNTDPEWFEALVPQLALQYQEFLKGDLEEQILTYRADYVVSESALPEDILKQLPSLAEPQIVGRYKIYSFPRE